MNVDVSPDGRRLVFDLLGDIYTMPIEGGQATRVLGGPAFEMQPRFSPDGTRIAFTSDRDGLWNIWTMKADGDEPEADLERGAVVRQQPDVGARRPGDLRAAALRDDAIARRRRGVDVSRGRLRRAAGHARARTQQKDVGEPAISPDGKYLYYSKDVTPGAIFEYNKDPNGVIFAILRRDLADRPRTSVRQPARRIGDAAAVARRPSLAFIRRVGSAASCS